MARGADCHRRLGLLLLEGSLGNDGGIHGERNTGVRHGGIGRADVVFGRFGGCTVDRGRGPESLIAVYVPTNHLYLGDIVLCPRERAFFPDVTVEEGIRIFLTGGMSLPGRIKPGSGTS